MNNKRRLSPVIISLVLVMILAIVPVFAFTSSAASDVTVKFAVPDGLTAPSSQTVSAGSSITLPTPPNYSGYTAVGWTTDKVSDETTAPKYYAAGSSYTATEDVKLYALYSETVGGSGGYEKTDIGNIAAGDVVVITMTKSGTTYALTNTAVSKNPKAPTISIVNNEIADANNKVTDAMKWNVKSDENGYSFYPNGTEARWLYCTNANAGVGVGTGENKYFDIQNNYIHNKALNRFVGVYTTNPDWRCYTSTGTNISGQTLAFFKLVTSITYYTVGEVTEQNTVSFSVPANINVAPISGNTGSTITLPTVSMPEGLEAYTFVGWAKEDLTEDSYAAPTLYNGSYTIEADETLYAVFSTSSSGSIYLLADDTSDLSVGKNVIIASKDNQTIVLSTEQKSNNRGQTTVSIVNGEMVPTASTQILTLNEGKVDNTFAFYTGSGYLYAASSSGNQLKTQTTLDANGPFTIEIEDGKATIIAQGSNCRKLLQYNSQSSLFACYAEDKPQQAIALYVESTGEVLVYTTKICAHEAGEGVETKAATCTEEGTITFSCKHCGNVMSEEKIDKLAHTPDNGTVTKDPTCTAVGTLQYKCSVCGTNTSKENIPMADHVYTDGVCETCGKQDPATLDFSGRYYIAGIRSNEETYKYTSIVLKNNRLTLGDSALAELPEEITNPSGAYTFVIEKDEDGSYFIYADAILGDAKYLGYELSGSTHKVVFVTRDEAEALDITALDNGTVSIIGKTSGRYLTFNGTATNNYCSWYASGQLAGVSLVPVADDAELSTLEISGASITIGADLAMKYYIVVPAEFGESTLKMIFTLRDGEPVEVKKSELVNDKYVFSFTGIAPQSMADNIKAELYVNNNLVAVKDNYSIKQNAINILAADPDNAVLRTLISDMLAYGAAAQEYRNYNKGNLANAGIEGLTPSETVPGLPDRYATKSTSEDVYFISAGVHFDYANKMYAKFYAKEGTSFEIYINGTEAYWTKINDTTYIVYTDFISATAFDVSAEFVLKVDGAEVQTLTYNVNSYAYSQYEIDDAMGRLALALYRYGVSAKAYKENN